MKQMSLAYLIASAVSGAIAVFSFFMVYLAVTSQSSGAWLFGAFGLLFSMLPASALIRVLASRSELFSRIDRKLSPPRTNEDLSVRFTPHWMMLVAMIAIALVVLSLVINVIRSVF